VFERMWPELRQPWHFIGPEYMAVNKNGNVFVADAENNCIQKFSSDGIFITKWGTHYRISLIFAHQSSNA